jgi:hypothetical protein
LIVPGVNDCWTQTRGRSDAGEALFIVALVKALRAP